MLFYLASQEEVPAQGTAFSYQGRLNDSGAPANTNYDFRFTAYPVGTNGVPISATVTNLSVAVSSGLFITSVDFGPGIFNGTTNGGSDWLEVGVRPSGGTNFTILTPREPILPVPYALFAVSASNLLGSLQATQIVGTIASSVVSGNFSNTVNFLNGANAFNGTFAGNGLSVTNLNASNLASGTVADARLSANVALLGNNQTFTGANSFAGIGNYSGINTFTNNANSFTGSFFGNGLVGWAPLTATSTNAARDHGYLLLSGSLTTVTLPSSATLSAGDIIRVSGGGTGGWLVKTSGGQSIAGPFASYNSCYLSTLSQASSDAYGVAISADGARMYVVTSSAGVSESGDAGQTWNTVSGTFFAGPCISVACSANGKIVYAEPGSGTIQKSTDYGLTWGSAGVGANGKSISCSSDGTLLFTGGVACSSSGTYRALLSGGAISYSVNGGSTYTGIASPAAGVTCLGVSSDCTHLIAGVSNGLLYASSNLGASWTALTATNQVWVGAWMAPDGSKFAAAARNVAGIGGAVVSGRVIPLVDTTTTSSVGGGQGSAVELQYIGGGVFVPASSSGLVWAN